MAKMILQSSALVNDAGEAIEATISVSVVARRVRRLGGVLSLCRIRSRSRSQQTVLFHAGQNSQFVRTQSHVERRQVKWIRVRPEFGDCEDVVHLQS